MNGEKIIGINLGTTNSVVSVVEAGEGKVIPNAEGNRLTPSVVAYTQKEETLVGEPARQLRKHVLGQSPKGDRRNRLTSRSTQSSK